MIVVKITYGFFSQIIDTEKKELVAQNFIAGDQVDWEDENGDRKSTRLNSSHPTISRMPSSA